MRSSTFVRILGVCFLVAAQSSWASSAKRKTFNDFEFLKDGKTNGIAVNERGVLKLGYRLSTLWAPETPYIWDVVEAGKNAVLASVGSEGQVYRVDLASGKARLVFDADEAVVSSLCPESGETFLAATSPDGKVYRVDAAGKAQVVFDPPDKYIWDLVVGPDGSILVATGEKGRLYRVGSGGKVDTLLRTNDQHVRCLVLDADGAVYAGTSDNGIIYRVDRQGKVRVLYDAPLEEVVQLALTRSGDILAATLGKVPAKAQTSGKTSASTSSTTERLLSILGETKQKSEVYRLDRQGFAEKIWNSSEEQVYTILPESDSTYLLGTGASGKVYRLSRDGEKSYLGRFDPSHVVRLLKIGREVVGCTANPGRVVVLRDQENRQGEYVSPVYDAKLPSRWGSMMWRSRGKGTVELYTRSGNTKKPDETWSPWQGPLRDSQGEHVSSPVGRFFQWKLTLKGERDLEVRDLALTFLRKNAPPRVKEVTVYGPNILYTGAATASSAKEAAPGAGLATPKSLGDKKSKFGYRTIRWSFEDPNADKLVFDVAIRHEAWKRWKSLGHRLAESAYALDTRTLPEGRYRVRVIASDSPENPPGVARVSPPATAEFVVDHTPPVFRKLKLVKKGDRTWLEFEVSDALNRLNFVQLAVDAGDWQKLAPVDGLCDTRHERFSVPLAKGSRGQVVALRAADAAGNIGYTWTEAE